MTVRGLLQSKLFSDSNFALCLHFKTTKFSFGDVWSFGNHITGISLIKLTSYLSKVLTRLSAAWAHFKCYWDRLPSLELQDIF